MFGTGWALSGICPGPAVADVSTLQPENLAFLGALAVGMLVAQRLFGLDVPKGSEPQSAPSEGEPAV